jgi:hypothetical protein
VLDAASRAQVGACAAAGGAFVVVDEGPGLSGSTMLAAAEALLRCGAPASRVVLLGSHSPDLARLRAPNAAARWQRFSHVVAPPTVRPQRPGLRALMPGEWRACLARLAPDAWPAVWLAAERVKLLSPDNDVLYKFEGSGRWGCAAAERARALADAGLGPPVLGEEDGFVAYAVQPGPGPSRPTPALVSALARLLAFRADALPEVDVDVDALEEMIAVNVEEVLGARDVLVRLPVERVVRCDGRLALHEWVTSGRGALLKCDGVSHGDDHFFPGPCDVAWDVAGAAVEWGLDDSARAELSDRIGAALGDPTLPVRLDAWEIAYAAFRVAHASYAEADAAGTEESARIARDVLRYRQALVRALSRPRASFIGPELSGLAFRPAPARGAP